MRIDRYALKTQAKASLRAANPGAVRMTLLYFLLTSGLGLIGSLFVSDPTEKILALLQAGMDLPNTLALTLPGMGMVGLFLSFFLFIFGIVMDYGYTYWILGSTRGGIGEYSDLICGFSMAGRVLALRLLVALIQLGWYFVIFTPVILVVSVAAMVPFFGLLTGIAVLIGGLVVYVSQILRYSMAVYCLIDDPDGGVFTAIRRSRELMRGSCWEYFKLMLSFFGWYVLEAAITLSAEFLVLALFGGAGLLEGMLTGQTGAMESAAGVLNSGLLQSLIGLTPWILNVWLTPYVMMSEAKFYDLLRGAQPRGSVQY